MKANKGGDDMKQLIKIIILATSLFANEKTWSSHSAEIIEKGRWEMGLFQPLRYGYTEKTEFSIHPGWFFLMPNIEIKEAQEDFLNYKVASQYKISYPTVLLNMLSGEGIGMLIAPEHEIPPMFSLSGSLIGTQNFRGLELSLSGGFDLGIVLGDLNPISTIDLPLVYHRLGVFYNGWGLHTGLDIEKNISKRTEVLFDMDIILLPGYDGNYSFENKLLLIWNKSNNFRAMTGFKFIAGDFPYGKDSRILPYLPVLESWVPILELQWAKSKNN
jgi:hypothetical protein